MSTQPTAGGRLPLSRERILDAAIAMVDEAGLGTLTMRRLGAQLGVEAMSLYRYLPSRDDLLDGMVERVMKRLSVDEMVLGGAAFGWQEFLERLAHGVRKVARTHPQVFPLVASRAPEAPWLRPPLRDLRLVEAFLTVLSDYGFDDEQSVIAYRAFTSFLLGHLLLEVSTLGADVTIVDQEDDSEDETTPDGLDDYPRLCELAPELARDRSAAEFEDALEALLERLAAVAGT